MAESGAPSSGRLHSTTAPALEFIHGRQPLGLGGASGRPDGQWPLVAPGEISAHQPPGDVGRGQSLIRVPEELGRVPRAPLHGQCFGPGVFEERGRDEVALLIGGGHPGSPVLQQEQNFAVGKTFTGEIECSGGRFVQGGQGHLYGMVPAPPASAEGPGFGGLASLGPVRYQEEQKGTDVRVPFSGPPGVEGGCPVIRLGLDTRVRVSTVSTHQSGSGEGVTGGGLSDNSGGAVLAVTEVVHTSTNNVSGLPTTTPVLAERRVPARVQPAPLPGVVGSSRLAAVERSLQSRGFSGDIAQILRKSTRASSAKVYDGKWQAFVDWCGEREVNPLETTVRDLANFLIWLSNARKLSVSAIKGYRSALAHTWRASGAQDPSVDPVIAQMVRGFELDRPRTRQTLPPWNLSVVLNYLLGPPFEPMRSSSWRALTLKTVFLIAFATAARRSELHALSAEEGHMAFSDNGRRLTLRLAVGFLAKNQAPDEIRKPYSIKNSPTGSVPGFRTSTCAR